MKRISNIFTLNLKAQACRAGDYKSARLCLKIKESMSQGRKIFRFLKSLDELKTIQNFLKTTNKPLFLKVLITLRHVSSFFYYILDNTLWGVKTGVLKYKIQCFKELINK